MISEELRSTLHQRAKHLSASTSPVAQVEAMAYLCIANSGQSEKFIDHDGILVPSNYLDTAPEIVSYAHAVADTRKSAFEEVGRFWDNVSSESDGPARPLLHSCVEQNIDLPTLLLSISPTELKTSASLLRIDPSILSNALAEVPYWKASEMLEFRNWINPAHDITGWIQRDSSSAFEVAAQYHYLHEANHPPIDYFSKACGWEPSNWLTEGVCEYVSSSDEVHHSHCSELTNEYGDAANITWSNIQRALAGEATNIRFKDYTLGWIIVHGLSMIFDGNEKPSRALSKVLSLFYDHKSSGNLNATFDSILDDAVTVDRFNNSIQKIVSRHSSKYN